MEYKSYTGHTIDLGPEPLARSKQIEKDHGFGWLLMLIFVLGVFFVRALKGED